MSSRTILWRRLDQPGHESARVFSLEATWRLAGTALFAHEAKPCCLSYLVVCDSEWRTISGRVSGWVDDRPVEIGLAVDDSGRWWLNGSEQPEVEGCLDLDLNFSPSTNLLPIRRLNLGVGDSAEVRAAWLTFPAFTLEPLSQLYRRVAPGTYRYESGGGRFVREIATREDGLVTDYPGFWAVAAQS